MFRGIVRSLGRLENYLNHVSAAALLLQIASTVISVSGLFLAALKLGQSLYPIIFVVLAVASFFLLTLNNRLFNERQIVKDILTFIAHSQRQQYKYIEVEEKNSISDTGDGRRTHRYQILALGPSVHWVKFKMNVPKSTSSASLRKLRFSVTDTAGTPLRYHAVVDAPTVKEIIVLFNKAATPDSPYGFTYRYTWPGSWEQLTSELHDHGFANFISEVDSYKLVMKMPEGLKLKSFDINPDPRQKNWTQVDISQDGRSVEWTMKNVVKGEEYRYDVYCDRTK
jgi:hypothetical protein